MDSEGDVGDGVWTVRVMWVMVCGQECDSEGDSVGIGVTVFGMLLPELFSFFAEI